MPKALALLVLLTSCAKAPAQPEPVPAPDDIRALYQEAETRLTTRFLEGGRVVSRTKEGAAHHQGDSLIWSGLALFGLSCEAGNLVEDTLVAELHAQDGALQRYPGLQKPVSFDGAIGLYRGIADRIQRCPGAREKWAPAIQKHAAYVAANDGRLGPGGARLEANFGWLLDRLASALDVRGADSGDSFGALENEAAAWALVTVSTRSAAYRIHLGLLALETAEALGTTAERNRFCQAAAGASLPGVQWWCGYPEDLRTFIAEFQYDRFEYALQRSPVWESPDGKDWLETPGLDLLVAVRTAYQL